MPSGGSRVRAINRTGDLYNALKEARENTRVDERYVPFTITGELAQQLLQRPYITALESTYIKALIGLRQRGGYSLGSELALVRDINDEPVDLYQMDAELTEKLSHGT